MASKGKVTTKDATISQKGVSLLSTDQKTITGQDTASNVTPASLKAKLGTQEIGRIAIGGGVDQVIKWIKALSSDDSISITYNAENETIDFKATGIGDVKSICVPETFFSKKGELLADPVCILPDSNGSLNFTSDAPIVLTPTTNGLKISLDQSITGIKTINDISPDSNGNIKLIPKPNITINPTADGIEIGGGSGGGDPNVIVIQDSSSITRVAEDRTIYIINNTNAKAILKLPRIARLGFWFKIIGISGGCYVNINEAGDQKIKYKNNNEETSLLTDEEWQDACIICYEENVRFKWLTF